MTLQPRLTMTKVVAFHEARRQFTTAYFSALWRCTGGNVSEMARLSGIGRAHVRKYLHDLAIAPRRSAPGADVQAPVASEQQA